MVRKNAKTDGQKRSETDSPKSAETVEKVRKQAKNAKTIGVVFVDRLWPFFENIERSIVD